MGSEIMDEDDAGIQGWSRAHLGEEPIYCAAPPPSNPDDVLYVGSDEELDESTKVAKRLRYETQALRYLEGKPIRIMSASLRGPFDKASGWENPWLPKQPVTKKTVSKPAQPAAKPSLATKQRFLRRSRRLVQQDDTTADTENSIRCELPSPSSNREPQINTTPPPAEKRIRIQAWAKNVSLGPLERDPFWAPGPILHEENTEQDKKRPVGKDWLKGKQPKRKKLGNSQTTAAASTPMPITRAQPSARSRSVPTNSGHVMQPVLPNTVPSRSFELPTPSSTRDQDDSEIPRIRNRGRITSRDELSNASTAATSKLVTQTEGIVFNNTHTQLLHKTIPECEPASGLEMNSSKQVPENTMDQHKQNEEENGMESYLDQSFHYRARPARKTTPILNSELTQTGTPEGTPESPVHADDVTDAIVEIEKRPADMTYKSPQVNNGGIQLSQQNKIIGHVIPTETKPTEDQETLIEHTGPTSDSIGGAFVASKTNISHSPEDKVKHTEEFVPVQDNLCAPYQATEMKTFGDSMTLINHTIMEAHIVPPKPLVEKYTLIGDAVSANPKGLLEAVESSATHNTIQSPKAVAVAEPHDAMQDCEDKVVGGSDSESDSIIVPLSQLEWGIAEAICSTPKVSKAVTKSETNAPVPEPQGSPGKATPARVAVLEHPESITQRSRWVTDLPSGADLTAEHIKSEPPDNYSSYYPYRLTSLTPHTSSDETPRAGPSQQSPWAGEMLEPVKHSDRIHYSTIPIGDIPMGTGPSMEALVGSQSPWGGENISIPYYPQWPPVSSAVAGHDGKLLHPPSQPTAMAVESEQQLPNHELGNPSTPPRISSPHARTPDLEKSIMPFAMFNTPSPKRSSRKHPSGRYSSTGLVRSILSSAKHSNPWQSQRSSRRVSFAPLPTEQDDADIPSASAPGVTRAASPPPQIMADTEDDDVDGRYQKHFDAVKRRTSGGGGQIQMQPQLLPSFSQQKPSSPAFDAMAAAFQEADAHMAHEQRDTATDIKENPDREMNGAEQTPWREDSQGLDDVAAVMNNLGDFLGAFDVDELMRQAQSPIRESQYRRISG